MAEETEIVRLPGIIEQLKAQGVDAATIAMLLNYMARTRWDAAKEADLLDCDDVRPAALRIASELDDHRDRIRGINIMMIGLRETIGEETSIVGAHRICLDLADHAQRLRQLYNDHLADIGMKP